MINRPDMHKSRRRILNAALQFQLKEINNWKKLYIKYF